MPPAAWRAEHVDVVSVHADFGAEMDGLGRPFLAGDVLQVLEFRRGFESEFGGVATPVQLLRREGIAGLQFHRALSSTNSGRFKYPDS